METKFAKRLLQVKPSPTLAVSEKAAQLRSQGRDIIGLGTGEPDFDTPSHIKDAAIKAIEDGFTKYTPVDGIKELKEAIINKFKSDNQTEYKLDQVLVSVGGKQSCFNLCLALLNEGDEVLIPAPYWVSYPDMVLIAEGTPVIMPTTPAMNYKITADQLAEAITPKTKMLFLNSPSNPSGISYSEQELKDLAEVLLQHPHVLIASDDMYEHIIWSQKFVNILMVCPELYDRTILLNGVSKAYSMTGWRIGYAAGPASIIKAMKKIQSQSTSNACSIAQKAAVAALNGGKESVLEMVESFHERHDYVASRLKAMSGVEVVPSDGTFYIFPNILDAMSRKGFANDVEFAEKLLDEEGLAIVPGSAFGIDGCIRISFAVSMDTLKDAMDRLERFMRS
ncbi:MAG: pyridoxal phosphate-dependent aminotransferase [Legionellaceae bacterium]|nr:pyridoxal phosphate-dependent aminotransferase [Legionellaceae bacterium]